METYLPGIVLCSSLISSLNLYNNTMGRFCVSISQMSDFELPSWLAAEVPLESNFLIPSPGVLCVCSSESFPLPRPRLGLRAGAAQQGFPPQAQCWIPLSGRASFPALDRGPDEQLGMQAEWNSRKRLSAAAEFIQKKAQLRAAEGSGKPTGALPTPVAAKAPASTDAPPSDQYLLPTPGGWGWNPRTLPLYS